MASPMQKRRGRPTLTSSTKKRRVQMQNMLTTRHKVYIGRYIEQWKDLLEETGLSNPDLAGLLINSYHKHREKASAALPVADAGPSTSMLQLSDPALPPEISSQPSALSDHRTHWKNKPTTSTPAVHQVTGILSEMSEVSSILSDQGDVVMSGVEELPSKKSYLTENDEMASTRPTRKRKTLSESFINPFDLSIDVTIDYDEDEAADLFDHEDPDYEPMEPSVNFTLLPHGINLEDLQSDNSDIDDDDDEDDDQEGLDDVDEAEESLGSGLVRIKSDADADNVLQDEFCLISLQQLILLAETSIKSTCSDSKCNEKLSISTESVGSAVYLKWVCPAGHLEYKWCSQPILKRRLHSGDLLTSAAILMSGNNFRKISLFARMLNLKLVSPSTFHKIQRHYLIPSVDQFWGIHQQQMLEKYKDKDIVILGDGRMDSPGFAPNIARILSWKMIRKTSLISL
ncbi:uncharacterized protein [Ptychodera flava]|uniref:uncharacterized protein n=1 Tax=Ptychodera flava TaxID=63121 RepID=UPI003969D2E7